MNMQIKIIFNYKIILLKKTIIIIPLITKNNNRNKNKIDNHKNQNKV